MDKTRNALLAKGMELKDKGEFSKAIEVFFKFFHEYPDDPKLFVVHTILGGMYSELNEHEKAADFLIMATKLRPDYEIPSLGLYVTYIELDNYEKAITELKRYLNKYQAELYIDTLKELLEDLRNGYAVNYKNTINELAIKHRVNLS